MMTRARTALAIVLGVATAPAAACKPDRGRPTASARDAGEESAARTPIASGAGDPGSPTADRGGAAAATDGGAAPPDAATEPPVQPEAEPEPASKAPSTKPDATGGGKADKGGTGDKGDKGGGARPTNLKVLPASWPLARVKDYMKKQVTRGLGVKCQHCHDTSDYAADGNEHKQAARSMIQMTGALNRQFFRGKETLTCVTCHQGRPTPAGQ